MERSDRRVELRRNDGRWDTGHDLHRPLLWDIYHAGGFGAGALGDVIRTMQREINALKRRGA